VWCLCFLKECAETNVSFNESDFDRIHTDCTCILKQFTEFLDKFEIPSSSSKEFKLKDKIEKIIITHSFYPHVLLSSGIDSTEFKEVIYDLLDDAGREPYKAKAFLGLIDTLALLRRNSCRGAVCSTSMESTRQRFMDIAAARHFSKSKNETEKIIPCAPYLVFDKQVPLEEYLFCSKSMSK